MAKAVSVNDVFLRYYNHDKNGIFCKRKNATDILKGISFTLNKGEILGIIGPNGSGKSTLLKVIAGLMSPEKGSVELYGNKVSLLALGVGFHNDLSGKDNIYLSGILMGYSKKEIDQYYDKIVSFSELGDYIDEPVKTYSSGMRSKLTFAIAINLHVDILLIDEVFSVGDIHFKTKSRLAMEKMIKDKNLTVIIVSHNLSEIKKICKRILWIDDGKIEAIGDPKSIIDMYLASMSRNIKNVTFLETPSVIATSDKKRIHLTWNKIENATNYRVYRKENIKGARWGVINDGCTKHEFFDIPPSNIIEFIYTVRAHTDNGQKDIWSDFIPTAPIQIKKIKEELKK